MQAAAKTLRLTNDELKSALGSGASLSDLAEQQGVKKDDLVAAMVETLKSTRTQLPEDATRLATKLVDRKGPGGPPRHDSSSTTSGRLVDRYA